MLVSPENLADTPFFHPDRPQEIEHAFPWPRSCAADLLCLSYSSCTPQEKGFLLQFINGLSHDGGLATSWQDVTDCCKWEGITCRQANTVTDVLLVSKGPVACHWDWCHLTASPSLMSVLTSSMEHCKSCRLQSLPSLCRY